MWHDDIRPCKFTLQKNCIDSSPEDIIDYNSISDIEERHIIYTMDLKDKDIAKWVSDKNSEFFDALYYAQPKYDVEKKAFSIDVNKAIRAAIMREQHLRKQYNRDAYEKVYKWTYLKTPWPIALKLRRMCYGGNIAVVLNVIRGEGNTRWLNTYYKDVFSRSYSAQINRKQINGNKEVPPVYSMLFAKVL